MKIEQQAKSQDQEIFFKGSSLLKSVEEIKTIRSPLS